MAQKKRRKHKRIHLIYYLLVFDRTTDHLVGHLVDITPGGLKLMSKDPVESGKSFEFRMILPIELDGTNRQLLFNTKCMWCKKNVYSDFYGAGFEISDIDKEDIDLIKRLIEDFGYRD